MDVLAQEDKKAGVISGDVSGNDDYLRFLTFLDLASDLAESW